MNFYHFTPAVLDGGLGTTLEDVFSVDISHTPLWSAKVSAEKPQTVVASHLGFLRAGARIILTSTYQCSLSTYRRAGYSDMDAIISMRDAVRLAGEAKVIYAKEKLDSVVKIALSLGPFGASLIPAQDFDGCYPPPFGPAEYSASASNYNSFSGDVEMENAAVEALTQFHLERLLIFARDPTVWGMIDCVAFETIPLVREVKAIRQAMSLLLRELSADDLLFKGKPWWISFVFPDGQCPERQYTGGMPVTASDMVYAALQWEPAPVKDATRRVAIMPIPSGIGINCTPLKFFAALVNEMSEARISMRGPQDSKPWLVLYPNGGDTYDPVSRTWSVREESNKHSWAIDFGRLVKEISSTIIPNVWSGVVCGGCCRTVPEDIIALSQVLSLG
ncbi:Homocysteine S-methyltransferase [Collybia nuda]|uniref:Homocysteine S-methyltransferase n=1 Tax=Collybia nuda TaxID=64659 RepID=A0A9P5Y2S8_9AGAR|nr:Homocysteine S-methyltransferase [Collybia nuda]